MLVPAYCKFPILREFKILWEYKKESTKLLLMILWSLQLSGKWQRDMKIWRDFTWFPFVTLTYVCTNRVIGNYRPSGRDNSAHTGGWVLSGCPSGSPGGQEMSVTPPDGDPQPSRAWSSHQITKHSEQPLLACQGKASVPAKVYKLIEAMDAFEGSAMMLHCVLLSFEFVDCYCRWNFWRYSVLWISMFWTTWSPVVQMYREELITFWG